MPRYTEFPMADPTHDCTRCGARCCSYFCFEIDEPDEFDEFENIRWFLCHEGVTVHIDDGDWFISLNNRCKMLDTENRCRIYYDRPMICREYDPSDCDHTSGGYGYDEEFNTPEEIEAYARKTLGPKKYDKARTKALAKIAKKIQKKKDKNGT